MCKYTDDTHLVMLTPATDISMAASQLVTRSNRHPVDSSQGQLVTGQLVTRSTRHAVDSSQRGGQLVTSKQTSKHQSRTAAAV